MSDSWRIGEVSFKGKNASYTKRNNGLAKGRWLLDSCGACQPFGASTTNVDLITEFRTEAEIALWERDPARSEEIDSHTASRIEIGRGPQRVTLSRDEGIFGDATYRLLYQVE